VRRLKFGIFFLALCCMTLHARAGTGNTPSQLTEIARNLCAQLRMDETIEVRIDESNELLVSSEPLPGSSRGFRISFDKRFLETLSDDEIAGAIAHELGHVWIFTHHPYLQTETLANEIALRVVTRETMTHVYSRMWSRTGVVGNIDELLGPVREKEAVKSSVSLH
jgi:hypothetical protein